MSRRPFAQLAVLSAGALALCAAVPAGASARTSVTGNARAIAFYKAVANATNALPSYVITQTGYVHIYDRVERGAARNPIDYAWAAAQWRHGYYAASERIVLAQSRGRTVWLLDTLTPLLGRCHASCPPVYPIQLFITKGGAFAGIALSGTTAPCFEHEALSQVPYGVGTRWWFPLGRFSPLARSGPLTVVTSRYPDNGRRVTEVDSASTRTHLMERSVFKVAAAGPRLHAFAFRQSDATLPAPPHPPRVVVCS